jgi:predicted regulator of Ras-like GTPase activity (Roadblock/LC7/MglB family)
MNDLAVTLRSLRDLSGIQGSFLVNGSGAVIAQDMPAYFGEAASEVGPRVTRLCESLSVTAGEVDRCVLRYGTHVLSLWPIGANLLTVVASASVNMPALRMASTLVARRLEGATVSNDPDLGTSESATFRSRKERDTEPPPTLREPFARQRSAGAPEASSAHKRKSTKDRAMYYRGKRIG